MAKGKSVNTADQPSKAWSSRANALTYNPGAQGTVSFGGSFKPETSNLKPGKLAMPQTIANPGKGPVNNKGDAPGNVKVAFNKGQKLPGPAKNRVGFTTSD
jgi:hypothetical protein